MITRKPAHSIAFLCLAASAQATLAAEPAVLGLGVGVNWSTGDYGTGTDTDILSIPLSARYERGPLTLKLTVPYLRVSGATPVVPGVGRVASTNPRGRGRGGGTTVASGLGDIVAAATYNAYYSGARKLGLDLTGKVKLGTADPDEGLGTGEHDVGAQVDVYKTYDRVGVFAGIGYTVLGSSRFIELNDVWNASLGATYRLDARDSVGVAYDWRERASPSAFALREVSAFWTRRLDQDWKAQAYVLRGLSDGSPDWGAGASLAYTF